MFVIKYTKSPRGYLVGYIKNDGKYRFFCAPTESQLFERGVASAKNNFNALARQVCMDSSPMPQDEFPAHLLTPNWYTMWWTGVLTSGKPAAPMSWDTDAIIRRKLMGNAKKIADNRDKKQAEEIKEFDFHFSNVEPML